MKSLPLKNIFYILFSLMCIYFLLKIFIEASEISFRMFEIEFKFKSDFNEVGFKDNFQKEIKNLSKDYTASFKIVKTAQFNKLFINFKNIIPNETDIKKIIDFTEKYFEKGVEKEIIVRKNPFLSQKNIEIIIWLLSFSFLSGFFISFMLGRKYE